MIKKEENIFIPAPRVALRSMRNCYFLDVEDEGYMYYGIDDLIEGFFMHVGLCRPDEMTKEERLKMLEAIKEGTALVQIQRESAKYKREVRNLKIKVKELEMLTSGEIQSVASDKISHSRV